jgi:peptidyl-tRNA hydrolase
MKRLYLVVRADLPPGQQAVQACHALREFVEDHPDTDRSWFHESNTLVLLSAPDERAITRLGMKAVRAGVPCSEFREPDLDNAVTAIAVAPSGDRLCKRFPLALHQ